MLAHQHSTFPCSFRSSKGHGSSQFRGMESVQAGVVPYLHFSSKRCEFPEFWPEVPFECDDNREAARYNTLRPFIERSPA